MPLTTLATHTTGPNAVVNGTINLPAVAVSPSATFVRTQFDITNHTASANFSIMFTLDVSFDGGVTWNPMKNPGAPYAFGGRTVGEAPQTGASTFTGSISGNTLTVTIMTSGKLGIGNLIVGATPFVVAAGTYIVDYGTGVGAEGTYIVNNSQTVNSTTLHAGIGGLGASWDRLPDDGQGNLNRMVRASLTTGGAIATSLQVVELG